MSTDNSAQSEDILAWTLAAIARREQLATLAAVSLAGSSNGAKWEQSRDEHHGGYMVRRPALRPGATTPPWTDAVGERVALVLGESEANHVVANDPESVLRRCAADRKMLELHGGRGHSCPTWDEDGDWDETRHYNHEVCPVILAIAEDYGWTEGER